MRGRKRVSISVMVAAASVAASLLSPVPSAQADPTLGPSTWIHNSSDSTLSRAWTNGANWSTAPDHPSGVGAIAIINDDPDNNRNFSFTPTGTTADPVPPGQPLVTLGSLTVNNSSQYTNNFTSGSNQVFLDAAGDGPAQINLLGNATSSGVPNSLNAIFSFTDSVVITVDKTSSGSSLGDANFNGIYQGTGGLTKAGLGTATITNGSGVTKTYSGPTIVEAGRLRIGTQSGSPGAPLLNTSNISVASNAQLDLGPNAATFLFGTSSATPININGTGIQPGTPIGGTYGSSGAIRANTNITLQNNIVVQSNDATITANATGGAATLTLNGIISGDAGNRLQFGGFGNAPDGGRVILTADNTYAGGTNITRGIVEVSGANADLGAGDVFVDGASWLGPDPTIWGLAAGQLSITSGVLNAIDDTATLSLTGDTATYGGLGDGAVGGIATLGAGIEELIGGLVLGGITQTAPGTYGSTASGATFQDDRYFAGAGVVSLVPEPSSLAIIGLGAACLLRRRSR